MYGKFQTCSIKIIKYIIISLLLASSSLIYSQTITNNQSKQSFTVNGFTPPYLNSRVLLGFREKAEGDLYIRKKSYPSALKHYETAEMYLPDEADIYYNLGVIYGYEDIYSMAADYFKTAIDKYSLPADAGKPPQMKYLAMIRYAFFLEKGRDKPGNHDKAVQELNIIESVMPGIKDSYPDVAGEYQVLYKLIYGTTRIEKEN